MARLVIGGDPALVLGDDAVLLFVAHDDLQESVIDLAVADLFLVAAGIVAEKYKDKNIQMHRFNLRNNKIYDCDMDGVTIHEKEILFHSPHGEHLNGKLSLF